MFGTNNFYERNSLVQSTGTNILQAGCVQCLEPFEQDYFWCNTKRLNVELGQEKAMTLLLVCILIVLWLEMNDVFILNLSGNFDQIYQVTESARFSGCSEYRDFLYTDAAGLSVSRPATALFLSLSWSNLLSQPCIKTFIETVCVFTMGNITHLTCSNCRHAAV